MAVWKVVGRKLDGRQDIKKIYETEAKYLKYGTEIIHRLTTRLDVEVYKMNDAEEWVLEKSFKSPRSKEQWKEMQVSRGYGDHWYEWKIKDFKL